MGCSKVGMAVVLLGWGLVAKAQQAELDQIAALRAYSQVVVDGYRLVEDGWRTVAAIRQGEWDLHKGYYASLLVVSPAVRGMTEVAEIMRKARDAGVLRDLIALLTDGQVSMTDGERMRRIVALRQRIK